MSNNDLKSLQELQDMLKEAELSASVSTDKYSSTNNKSVHQFVAAMEIGEGGEKVPTYLIYFNYVVWCREQYKKFCGNTEFFRTFKKYCRLSRQGRQRYYLLNETNKLNTSEEFNEKAKNFKTKPKSISSTKQEAKPTVP
jgi:hypothetical protein